jgi:hypothetical protein
VQIINIRELLYQSLLILARDVEVQFDPVQGAFSKNAESNLTFGSLLKVNVKLNHHEHVQAFSSVLERVQHGKLKLY